MVVAIRLELHGKAPTIILQASHCISKQIQGPSWAGPRISGCIAAKRRTCKVHSLPPPTPKRSNSTGESGLTNVALRQSAWLPFAPPTIAFVAGSTRSSYLQKPGRGRAANQPGFCLGSRTGFADAAWVKSDLHAVGFPVNHYHVSLRSPGTLRLAIANIRD